MEQKKDWKAIGRKVFKWGYYIIVFAALAYLIIDDIVKGDIVWALVMFLVAGLAFYSNFLHENNDTEEEEEDDYDVVEDCSECDEYLVCTLKKLNKYLDTMIEKETKNEK